MVLAVNHCNFVIFVCFRDADILSDKYEDVLVNVNIVDNERTKKSLANIKAGKEGYQVRY